MGAPTAWVPQSKPIWFTEVGCPAVDRGANQPNVFFDPKSSESSLPYYSKGRRDDAMQRAYLEAMLGVFAGDGPLGAAANPVSSVYGGSMVDLSAIHVWTWDARPWPAFPHLTEVWSDGANWERGHWLNGRLGGAPLGDLVRTLFADWGLPAPDVSHVPVVFDGFVVSSPGSLRSVLEPVLDATSSIGADTGTGIRILGLSRRSDLALGADELVELVDGELAMLAAKLPRVAELYKRSNHF